MLHQCCLFIVRFFQCRCKYIFIRRFFWVVNITNRKINVMQKHSLFGLLCKTVHYDAFLFFFPRMAVILCPVFIPNSNEIPNWYARKKNLLYYILMLLNFFLSSPLPRLFTYSHPSYILYQLLCHHFYIRENVLILRFY